jgi:ribosome-binding protein aMBF1 (putative translation factor)
MKLTSAKLTEARRSVRGCIGCSFLQVYDVGRDLKAVEYIAVDSNADLADPSVMRNQNPSDFGEARLRVAGNIRRLRLAKGLSQEKMAELADFHRTYVSQLERCVTNISVDGLERLAKVLGVDIAVLLTPLEDESA